MKTDYDPPRYIVQFPDGERELDALEIMRQFREWRIDTITRLRPVSGGEWRELREEPEFSVALFRQHKRLRRLTGRFYWLAGLLPFMLLLPFAPFFTHSPEWCFANWQSTFGTVGLHVFLMLFVACGCLNNALCFAPLRVKDLMLLIPYLNCVFGFFLYRQLIRELPPHKRRLPALFNSSMWALLLFLTVATLFLPGNAAAGKIVFSTYALWLLCFGFLSLPFLREAKRRGKRWQEQNPPPEEKKGKSPLATAYRRKQLRNMVVVLFFYLAAIVALFAILSLPYWLIGTIRLKAAEQELAKLGYSVPPSVPYEQSAAETEFILALLAVDLPDAPPYDANYKEELAKQLPLLMPQLDRFREILRSGKDLDVAPVLAWIDSPEINESLLLNAQFHQYLSWRNKEPQVTPSGAVLTELLEDHHMIYRYKILRIPAASLHSAFNASQERQQICQHYLKTIPDATLIREKERIARMNDQLPAIAKRTVLHTYPELGRYVLRATDLPVFYRNNVRATLLEQTAGAIPLFSQEYFETRESYLQLTSSIDSQNRFYSFLVSRGQDRINRMMAEASAYNRITSAALELEEYRRKHGSFPPSPVLPRDPFTGKSVSYLPEISLCANCANNEDEDEDEELEDHIVFYLW